MHCAFGNPSIAKPKRPEPDCDIKDIIPIIPGGLDRTWVLWTKALFMNSLALNCACIWRGCVLSVWCSALESEYKDTAAPAGKTHNRATDKPAATSVPIPRTYVINGQLVGVYPRSSRPIQKSVILFVFNVHD